VALLDSASLPRR